jgi:hypothetical protein
MTTGKHKICIVGTGNAAHALAALLPARGHKTTWLASFEGAADLINAALASNGAIEAEFSPHNEPAGLVSGRPDLVTADAGEALAGVDVLLMPLPSFAYPFVLDEIRDHLRPGMHLIVTPGQGGFDWVARDVLGELVDELLITALMPMPFNCRIDEMGHRVSVQEFKRRYKIAVAPHTRTDEARAQCEALFGHTENSGSFLNAALYPMNAIIHPARLFQLCADWSPDNPLPENPLFYEDMGSKDVALMDAVNQELIAAANALSSKGVAALSVPHIHDFLTRYVYDDASDLLGFFRNNPAYRGFRCPLLQDDTGVWHPDFSNRYFTEDIPLGLCVYKGVAELAGVATPNMDKIIVWAQTHMGKEYVVDGKLCGAHVGETNAPQRFGVSLEQL